MAIKAAINAFLSRNYESYLHEPGIIGATLEQQVTSSTAAHFEVDKGPEKKEVTL